jgi:hypothetical protein
MARPPEPAQCVVPLQRFGMILDARRRWRTVPSSSDCRAVTARRTPRRRYIPISINTPAINASAAISTPGIGNAANVLKPVRINQIPNRSIPALRVTRTAIARLLRASVVWNDTPATPSCHTPRVSQSDTGKVSRAHQCASECRRARPSRGERCGQQRGEVGLGPHLPDGERDRSDAIHSGSPSHHRHKLARNYGSATVVYCCLARNIRATAFDRYRLGERERTHVLLAVWSSHRTEPSGTPAVRSAPASGGACGSGVSGPGQRVALGHRPARAEQRIDRVFERARHFPGPHLALVSRP